jgi:hypothetical protein
MVYTMVYKGRQRIFESALADLDEEAAAASGGGGRKSTRRAKRR